MTSKTMELVNDIFFLKTYEPSTSQDEQTIQQLLTFVNRFVERKLLDGVTVREAQSIVESSPTVASLDVMDPLHDDSGRSLSVFSASESIQIQRMLAAWENTLTGVRSERERQFGDVWVVRWLPAYACVLLAEVVAARQMQLKLVCCDEWSHVIHFPPQDRAVHSAVATKYPVIRCVDLLPASNIESWTTFFDQELQSAQQTSRDMRSAVHGHESHQKTPQFIAFVAKKASNRLVSGSCGLLGPNGGTTDVGMHTGCTLRTTCWPLVCAVMHYFLSPEVLYDKMLVNFEIFCVEKAVKKLKSLDLAAEKKGMVLERMEQLFLMLSSVQLKAIKLLDLGYDVNSLERKCTQTHKILGEIQAKQCGVVASKFRVKDEATTTTWEHICMKAPPKSVSWKQEIDYDTIQSRAMENLDGVEASPSPGTLSSLINWLLLVQRRPSASYLRVVVLQLRVIERFLFIQSDSLDRFGESCVQSIQDVESMSSLLSQYDVLMKRWESSPSAELSVIQRSRAVLVRWVGACLVDKFCCASEPFFSEYGLNLKFKSLEVLVVKETKTRDAMNNVTSYIQRRRKDSLGTKVLFQLNAPSATQYFARCYAGQDAAMRQVLESEQRDVETRVQTQWRLVEDKKRRAEELRRELAQYRATLASEEANLRQEEAYIASLNAEIYRRNLNKRYRDRESNVYTTHRKQTLEASITNWQQKIRSHEAQLATTLKMPPPVIHPLPRATNEALGVLFMLQIPTAINHFSQLCFLAQNALLPCPLSAQSIASITHSSIHSWVNHFNIYKASSSTTRVAGPLVPSPANISVPQRLGQPTVDSYCDISHYRGDCEWFPPGHDLFLSWKSPSGNCIDPSKLSRSAISAYFTASLKKYPSLNWAIASPDECKMERGNRVYSSLPDCPREWSKDAFITLGSLRAAPCQQIRRLACALVENELPWACGDVATLLRQTLYHVGELSDIPKPEAIWKRDLTTFGGLNVILDALSLLANQLKETPRESRKVRLLSELAGALSQVQSSGTQIRNSFAAMAKEWAFDIRQRLGSSELNVSADEKMQMKADECFLYGTGLLCYALGPWDHSDMCDVVLLLFSFRYSLAYTKKCKIWKELEEINHSVDELMASRVDELFFFVRDYPNSLTEALKHVNSRVPDGLDWVEVQIQDSGSSDSCYCFAAWLVSESSNSVASLSHVAVNLLTGIVLFDGRRPSVLPDSILKNKTYVMLFGNKDFEVIQTGDVCFQTAHAFGGCYYNFALHNKRLLVEEIARGKETRTLRLCGSKWVKQLADVAPTRLIEMHSHWLWVEEDVVLFRCKSAMKKEVAFVLTLGTKSRPKKCFQVPRNEKNFEYAAILARLPIYDCIVRCESTVLLVLSKVEPSQYIHALVTSSNRLKVHFPRLGLHFLREDRGVWTSINYKGYELLEEQQLNNLFSRFTTYLLLHLTPENDGYGRSLLKMLVPAGSVTVKGDLGKHDAVTIVRPENCDATVNVVVYDEHRRLGTFQAEDIASRLQLAAIYTASGCVFPEIRLKMTGSEAALVLLRRSWCNRPLTGEEIGHLTSIIKFGYREPALRIAAASLLRLSDRVSFLFEQPAANSSVMCSVEGEMTEYERMCEQLPRPNALRRLYRSPEEEQFMMGLVRYSRRKQAVCPATPVELKPCGIDVGYVAAVEKELASLRSMETTASSDHPAFPLNAKESKALGKEMLHELQESWEAYHKSPKHTLNLSLDTLVQHLSGLISSIEEKRDSAEAYLSESIRKGQADVRSRLLVMSNMLPQLTLEDILQCSFDPSVLIAMAPRLSLKARRMFHEATLVFMELCVLEDKLKRLVHATRALQNQQASINASSCGSLMKDLGCVREWKSKEHPRWLAFEVEGRLQIRPKQYIVAMHLIKHPGVVCQLNMGEGKTRVILPMLFMHYMDHDFCTGKGAERIVRAHFLTALLSETLHFMHRYLSASTLEMQFFQLPFNRGVKVSLEHVRNMKALVDDAKRIGAFMIVAPEYRLSFELKQIEMRASGDKGDALVALEMGELVSNEHYVDILDESDALLNHKYHLVYAVGAPIPLEDGSVRWMVAQELLRILNDQKPSSQVWKILNDQALTDAAYKSRRGGYCGLRLNMAVKEMELWLADFRAALVKDLMTDASDNFYWLQHIHQNNENFQDKLIEGVTDTSKNLNDILKASGIEDKLGETEITQLLALRGFLAFGVLEHCLLLRNRVQYGLPDLEKKKTSSTPVKQLAVPYRAADLPSERSEFSHPDVAIGLTILTYYHQGLTEEQVDLAIRVLLDLDPSKQRYHYDKWYHSVEARLTVKEKDMLDDVSKIDWTNSCQRQVIVETYCYCMYTINFYLNTCVFPRDTKQYPQRLSRTAWNLSNNKKVNGFSGTKDNHRLLPLSVMQKEPDDVSLLGTNGQMLDYILKYSLGYDVVNEENESRSAWQNLLHDAVEMKVNALIDTGALLAGVMNHEAAGEVLDLMDDASVGHGDVLGVTYYDTRPEHQVWVVLDRAQRFVTQLKRSNIRERDTFVIFDEARTRGADMKLKVDAVAMLTLGPGITKDKLMQGAGRLRQLSCDQKLQLVSFQEVSASIRKSQKLQHWMTRPSLQDVLQWVLENTTKAALAGLSEWAESGIHFRHTQRDQEKELQDDNWSLEYLYASVQKPMLMSEHIEAKVLSRSDPQSDAVVAGIRRHGHQYGFDHRIVVSTHDEECERELQVEWEEQEQLEVSMLCVSPVAEQTWQYSKVLEVKTASALAPWIQLQTVDSYVAHTLQRSDLSMIPWMKSRVYGTQNFFSTVAMATSGPVIEFLRRADGMLVFPSDQSVVMLADREADAILRLLWDASRCQDIRHVFFVNYTYAVQEVVRRGVFSYVPLRVGVVHGMMSCLSMAGLFLWNGKTDLGKGAKEQTPFVMALREFLQQSKAREAVKVLVNARGNERKWYKSGLERLCEIIAVEFLCAA